MEATPTDVKDEPVKDGKKSERPRIWRETPLTKELLFYGCDEVGRTGWFLRLVVSGLFPRRIGPFQTQQEALAVLEEFIAGIQSGPLCDAENDIGRRQAYVVEGIPVLQGDHDLSVA